MNIMNIMNNESNTKDTIIKIEPPEQKVCNDIETTSMNLCENIKIEIFEHEVPEFYEDENFREKFPAPKETCAKDTKNSNINQNTINGYVEVPSNLENDTNVNKILDIEKTSTKINIKKLPESDKLRNDLFYYCKMCKVKCLSEKTLKAHMMLHDESRKFKCNTCEYRFKRKYNLIHHMMKHSEIMFECDTCGYKSKWKWHFKQHMKQKHDEIPADKNTNTKMTNNYISGSSQQNTTELNIDNSQSHNKDGGNTLYHQCNICDYRSFIKHSLDQHMKLHDLNRKYQCDVCLYRFRTKIELSRHMSKHSNKKYSCRVCGRQYQSEHGVSRHMHVHEGIQYRCYMCGHVFRSNYLLSTHMSHKHNNSYKCNVCLKMFTDSTRYTRHIKIHLQ